jgi:hypothetical protein
MARQPILSQALQLGCEPVCPHLYQVNTKNNVIPLNETCLITAEPLWNSTMPKH